LSLFLLQPHGQQCDSRHRHRAERHGSALAGLAGKLSKKGINIDCANATVHKGAKKAIVVLGTSKTLTAPIKSRVVASLD
jgi:hypothetical protein